MAKVMYGIVVSACMIAILMVMPINAYATTTPVLERMVIEAKIAEVRPKITELGNGVYANVTNVSNNLTDFPRVSGQLIGYTMAVAFIGGPENWQLLNKTFDAYRTQVLDNKQNLGFGNLLAAAFTAPLVKNVLSSAQNNTDGLIITGLNHGKTIQEIFEPFKKLANMSATRNMTSG